MSDGLNGGRDEARIAPCRWCGEKFTPAGVGTHQRHCDENPHPGVSYEKQVEHEIPPVGGDGPVPDLTGADESASEEIGSETDEETPDLPPVETLGPADD
jgi:hypothetical protein